MFLSEAKQHPVPLSINIPDMAYEAVLPCHLNLGRLSKQVLPKGVGFPAVPQSGICRGGIEIASKNLFFACYLTLPLAWFLCNFLCTSKESS